MGFNHGGRFLRCAVHLINYVQVYIVSRNLNWFDFSHVFFVFYCIVFFSFAHKEEEKMFFTREEFLFQPTQFCVAVLLH